MWLYNEQTKLFFIFILFLNFRLNLILPLWLSVFLCASVVSICVKGSKNVCVCVCVCHDIDMGRKLNVGAGGIFYIMKDGSIGVTVLPSLLLSHTVLSYSHSFDPFS
jgi:hypothetical protein